MAQSMNKKTISLVCLSLAALGVIFLTAFWTWKGINPSQATKLEVEKDLYDFGDVELNVPVSVAVRIKNTGSQPLQFTEKPYLEVVEGC